MSTPAGFAKTIMIDKYISDFQPAERLLTPSGPFIDNLNQPKFMYYQKFTLSKMNILKENWPFLCENSWFNIQYT